MMLGDSHEFYLNCNFFFFFKVQTNIFWHNSHNDINLFTMKKFINLIPKKIVFLLHLISLFLEMRFGKEVIFLKFQQGA